MSYDEEVQNLSTNSDKKAYLEAIFKVDQDVRDAQDEYKIGRNSKEYRDHIDKMNQTDLINLYKIETYLRHLGHPSKVALGEIAALTPWAVIHHQSNYEPRVKNFKYLYNAYVEGDIKESSFSMYLARMYQMKHGSRLDMGGPYQEKDKIARLISDLDLDVGK